MPFQFAQHFDCQYNGYVFGPRMETIDLRVRPVYDQSERTVTHSVFSLTLKDHIGPFVPTLPGGAEAAVLDARRKLTRPGGALKYVAKGLGGLAVNVGGAKDCLWGPRPRELAFRPGPDGVSAEITLKIEAAIPDCDDAAYEFALMELVYRLTFDVKPNGYTDRIYSGHLRIPQTRKSVDDRTLSDTADAYRERIVPPLLPGYRRVPGPFTVDESKCRLDWNITDQEMGPQALPAKVVEGTGRFTVHNAQNNLHQWSATLACGFQASKDVERARAWEAFHALALDRMGWARENAQAVAGNAKGGAAVIPYDLTVTEDVFGPGTVEMSLSWAISTAFSTILQASGVWRPVPDATHEKWAQSMQNVLGPRGLAGLKMRPQDDLILDLCRPTKPATLKAISFLRPPLKAALKAIPVALPKPDSSWLDYACMTSVEVEDGNVIHRTLPKPSELQAVTVPAELVGMREEPSENFGALTGLPVAKMFAVTKPFTVPYVEPGGESLARVQRRMPPRLTVSLIGRALRAGYYVAPPQLVSVGGREAVPMNRRGNGFRQWVYANMGLPVLAAEWNLRWELLGVPDAVGVPSNPAMGVS